jgi:ribonuclease HI
VLAPLAREKIAGYSDSVHIHTDAPKNSAGRVGIGCYVKETPCVGAIEFHARVTDSVSVFAGELAAIRVAFECAGRLRSSCGLTRYTILSDSLSAIKAVEVGPCQSRPNLFNDALESMSKAKAETILVCVPSHIGTEGNEKADRLANAVLDSEIVELDIGLELCDEFPAVDRFVLEKWQ